MRDREKCRWKRAILILCIVGVLKEFRPSGPFLVDYAVDHHEFTQEQMTYEVLPVTTKAYLITLLWLLIVTDVLCYKPIIVLGGIATVATWVVTIWFYHSLGWARVRQMLYGISAITGDVAFFTYMYGNIQKKDYKKVTSYTHSAVHFGQFMSGLVGQLLLSFHVMEFHELNYLSLGGAVAALFFSLFLPRILRDQEEEESRGESEKEKELEEMKKNEKEKDPESERPEGLNYRRHVGKEKAPTALERWKAAPRLAWESLKYSMTEAGVVKYSIWWALAYGLYIQVDLYVESLWKEIEHHSHQKVFNGAVHGSHAIISVVLGLLVARTKMCWIKWGCAVFGFGTVLQAVALYCMAKTHDLYIAYAAFIVFQSSFQVLVIISKSHVAELIQEGSEAFMFGVNSLAAVLVHFVLTFAVTRRNVFNLEIQDQYLVYAGYAFALGVLFFLSDKVRRVMGLMKTMKVSSEEKGEKREEADLNPQMPYSIPREH